MDKLGWEEFLRDYLNWPAEDELPAVVDYIAEMLEKEQIVPGNVNSESIGEVSVSYEEGIPQRYLDMLKPYRDGHRMCF